MASREHARALEWFECSAAKGNSTGQLCLAMLLLCGEGSRTMKRVR